MCFNTSTWSSFFCKLHVYCHIKSALYSLLFTVNFECLPLCYPAEPECCICLLHNIQKEKKKFHTYFVCQSGYFCYHNFSDHRAGVLPHRQGTEKFPERWLQLTCPGIMGISCGRWAMAHSPLLITLVVATGWSCSGQAGHGDHACANFLCSWASCCPLLLGSGGYVWWWFCALQMC